MKHYSMTGNFIYPDLIKYENKKLKLRLSHLSRTNTRLQNDLFSEQLIQDDTEDYINRLKQELFSEHLKQVETEYFIDKLKKELKEYRGF